MTTWKSDIPESDIFKAWHLRKWQFKSLTFLNVTFWNSYMLKFWHFESLTFWKSDILKIWHFESLKFLKMTCWKSDIFLKKLATLKMIPTYDLYQRPLNMSHIYDPTLTIIFSSQSMATTTIQWTNTQSLSLLFMTHTKATTPQITLLLISPVLLRKLNEIQCSLLQMLAVEPLDTTQR